MNCQRAREVFPELLDPRHSAGHVPPGSGEPAAHLEVRAHLAACPDCQREFAAFSRTVATLDTLPLPKPSPRLLRSMT